MIQKINKYLNKQNNFFIRTKYQITKKKKKTKNSSNQWTPSVSAAEPAEKHKLLRVW